MDVDAAFAQVRTAFPETAVFQGTHFKYAAKNGVTIIETRRSFWAEETRCRSCSNRIGDKTERYFYWIIVGNEHKLIHASTRSKFRPLQTIADSFSPSMYGDQHAYTPQIPSQPVLPNGGRVLSGSPGNPEPIGRIGPHGKSAPPTERPASASTPLPE